MTPSLIRLVVELDNNSRTSRGLLRLGHRRCNPVIQSDFTQKPKYEVSFDVDLGRYDSEGDALLCELLECVESDILSVERA